MFKDKIDRLKINIMNLANVVENMLRDSENAVYNNDHILANNVITNLESLVNRMETENETKFIEFLALFQPEAKDLRTVVALLKINNSLERIADHCVNIAKRVGLFTSIKYFKNLKIMFETTRQMFRNTFISFNEGNVERLKYVITEDKIVDDNLKNLTDEIINSIDGCVCISSDALSSLLIGRDLERIADLTTNICEDAIYMIEGTIIKHHGF